MNYATRVVLGRDVALAHNYLGLDLVEVQTPELVDDYKEARRLDRSEGYKFRQRVFGERKEYMDSLGKAEV